MRITIILAILALTTNLFLTSCDTVLAQEDNIGQSLIHPAHPLYFLKTIRENLELTFAGSTHIKMIRYLEFSTRRIREVKSLVKTARQDLIEPTLEKYWFNLSSIPDKDLEDKGLLELLGEVISTQIMELERIYDQINNKRAKIAIRAALNRLIGRADLPTQNKRLVCNFLAKEASSSALNEVEKAVLSERAQKCRLGSE